MRTFATFVAIVALAAAAPVLLKPYYSDTKCATVAFVDAIPLPANCTARATYACDESTGVVHQWIYKDDACAELDRENDVVPQCAAWYLGGRKGFSCAASVDAAQARLGAYGDTWAVSRHGCLGGTITKTTFVNIAGGGSVPEGCQPRVDPAAYNVDCVAGNYTTPVTGSCGANSVRKTGGALGACTEDDMNVTCAGPAPVQPSPSPSPSPAPVQISSGNRVHMTWALLVVTFIIAL